MPAALTHKAVVTGCTEVERPGLTKALTKEEMLAGWAGSLPKHGATPIKIYSGLVLIKEQAAILTGKRPSLKHSLVCTHRQKTSGLVFNRDMSRSSKGERPFLFRGFRNSAGFRSWKGNFGVG